MISFSIFLNARLCFLCSFITPFFFQSKFLAWDYANGLAEVYSRARKMFVYFVEQSKYPLLYSINHFGVNWNCVFMPTLPPAIVYDKLIQTLIGHLKINIP